MRLLLTKYTTTAQTIIIVRTTDYPNEFLGGHKVQDKIKFSTKREKNLIVELM